LAELVVHQDVPLACLGTLHFVAKKIAPQGLAPRVVAVRRSLSELLSRRAEEWRLGGELTVFLLTELFVEKIDDFRVLGIVILHNTVAL
jgi:hypothetical protein